MQKERQRLLIATPLTWTGKMKYIQLFITITATLLCTGTVNATEIPSSGIETLENSLLSYTRNELQKCAQEHDMDCNIRLALHNLSYQNKLND